MHLPAHDLPAEDVRYEVEVEVEEHPCDRPWHPGNVPGPDLTGCAGLIAGGLLAPDRRLGPAPVILHPLSAQDAVKAEFRGQIAPLIGQF